MATRVFWATIACLALLNCLDTPQARAQEQDQPAIIQADVLTYDQENDLVIAEGNVEVNYEDRVLFADKIVYNQVTDVIIAEGDVAILDKTGDVLFADRAELKDELKEGIVENIKLLLADDSKLAANVGHRVVGRLSILSKGVYSPCEVCADRKWPPLWQIKAYRVVHDNELKEIRYQDAIFELFGVPVGYSPYFSHPDPSVKRKSGFLMPSIGNSSDLGTIVEIPYYFALAQNYDATFSPKYTSDEGVVLQGEFRHRTHYGSYSLSGSITQADELNDLGQRTGGKDIRGHFFAEGEFELRNDWNAGFEIQQTSDDTYMRRYDITDEDRLENHAYLERFRGNTSLTAETYAFKDLRLADVAGETPTVLPLLTATHRFKDKVGGGNVDVTGNILNLFRAAGTDVTRISAGANWERTKATRNGQIWKSFASMRADGYFAKDLETPDQLSNVPNTEITGRALPQVGLDIRWPFARYKWKTEQIIEPVVQLIYSPLGGNPTEIPNEDSLSFEFDDTNLLSRQRFPGLDRWEDGMRANVGLRMAAYNASGGSAEVLFGQVFRVSNNGTFAENTGLENNASDYVGRINLSPIQNFSITHRFRLDRKSFRFARNEVSLNASYWRLAGSLWYTKLSQEETDASLTEREELTAYGRVKITDYWSASGSIRRDLVRKANVTTRLGLTYLDECTQLNLVYQRDFTSDRDIKPSTSILFTFQLRNLN
jgi:LPS-assembly protein